MKPTTEIHLHNLTSWPMSLIPAVVSRKQNNSGFSVDAKKEDVWKHYPPAQIDRNSIGLLTLDHSDGACDIQVSYAINGDSKRSLKYSNLGARAKYDHNGINNGGNLCELDKLEDVRGDVLEIDNNGSCDSEFFLPYAFRSKDGTQLHLYVLRFPIGKDIEFALDTPNAASPEVIDEKHKNDDFHPRINDDGRIEVTWKETHKTHGVKMEVLHMQDLDDKHTGDGHRSLESTLWSQDDPHAGCAWNPARGLFPAKFVAPGLHFRIEVGVLNANSVRTVKKYSFMTIPKRSQS